MKNIIIVVIICGLVQFAFSQNFGVDETSPGQKLDVAGWIELGNQTQGSSPTAGVMRYNTSGHFQYHNGSTWVSIGQTKTLFTRWGRDDCPSGSSLVYWGYAGGGHAGHNGSGANTICLTSAPSWSGASFSDANQNGALVYGVEFQSSGYGAAGLQFNDWDARCAVCLVNDASETIMVPGNYNCPSGWTRQYWGFVMADHYTQQPSHYVCVDEAPDLVQHNGSHDGSLWYPTETELGSLSGSGYVQNREVNCAVCTR